VAKLFAAQRLDGIDARGPARGNEAEDDATPIVMPRAFRALRVLCRASARVA
jgi:hypothetical protein